MYRFLIVLLFSLLTINQLQAGENKWERQSLASRNTFTGWIPLPGLTASASAAAAATATTVATTAATCNSGFCVLGSTSLTNLCTGITCTGTAVCQCVPPNCVTVACACPAATCTNPVCPTACATGETCKCLSANTPATISATPCAPACFNN